MLNREKLKYLKIHLFCRQMSHMKSSFCYLVISLAIDFSLFVLVFKDIPLSAYIRLLLRDLVIWRCFDENPVLWDIMDFLTTGKY